MSLVLLILCLNLDWIGSVSSTLKSLLCTALHVSCIDTALGEVFFFTLSTLLQYQTRAHLYETLGLWMRHVAEDKFQFYLESLGLQQFQEELRPQRLSMCGSLLQGLVLAMALPNPPNNCWTILCSTTEKIFTLLPNQSQV